ncbi:protease complex subunit PrcB family protein [Paludifilum halophilum]|nr:protease complex subunit PrcB family protein [Paludifilum halophilum]
MMRLRQVNRIMLLVTLLIGPIGCGTYLSDDSRGDRISSAEDDNLPTELSFQQEKRNGLPDPVKDELEKMENKNPKTPSHAEVQWDGKTYLILTTGQKSTGGYTIRIGKVVRLGNTVQVNAEEIPPPEDALNIQALTTPTTVISMNPPGENVEFRLSVSKREKKSEEKDQSVTRQTLSGSADQLKIRPEQDSSLPDRVREKAEQLRTREGGGKAVIPQGERTYFIIALGERKTGGYQVEVEDVVRQGSEIHIFAREVSPDPGMMVTQVITYPVHIVSIPRPEDDPDYHFHLGKNTSPSFPGKDS